MQAHLVVAQVESHKAGQLVQNACYHTTLERPKAHLRMMGDSQR